MKILNYERGYSGRAGCGYEIYQGYVWISFSAVAAAPLSLAAVLQCRPSTVSGQKKLSLSSTQQTLYTVKIHWLVITRKPAVAPNTKWYFGFSLLQQKGCNNSVII